VVIGLYKGNKMNRIEHIADELFKFSHELGDMADLPDQTEKIKELENRIVTLASRNLELEAQVEELLGVIHDVEIDKYIQRQERQRGNK
jgi:vacuolar-type H+-ATPase subunit I/STV1